MKKLFVLGGVVLSVIGIRVSRSKACVIQKKVATVERSRNVVSVAANRSEKRSNGEKTVRKQLARFCFNLLVPFDLSRLRQIVMNLVSRLLTEYSTNTASMERSLSPAVSLAFSLKYLCFGRIGTTAARLRYSQSRQ
jgi:hypothetical protein